MKNQRIVELLSMTTFVAHSLYIGRYSSILVKLMFIHVCLQFFHQTFDGLRFRKQYHIFTQMFTRFSPSASVGGFYWDLITRLYIIPAASYYCGK